MSDEELVKIAANIVPSPQQLRWQRIELTAFFYFGINTFTGREWGMEKGKGRNHYWVQTITGVCGCNHD